MHKVVAQEIMDYLHTRFPEASIGVGGSVANGNYTEKSDIDLLFLNKDYKHSHSVSFTYKGIRIGIFTYTPQMFLTNNLDLLYNHHSMRMTYIHITRPAYDPLGLIADLKESVEEVLMRRKLLRTILIDDLKEDIRREFSKRPATIHEEKEILYVVLERILSIVFLKYYSDKILSKKEAQNLYGLIETVDPYLHKNLKDMYPVRQETRRLVQELFNNYLITNY
ncbi:MAG: nucleotidyltransferase domain-containing protein [Bacteroides sp.]|nr:nucleotidyltransferase domain-containing protein [Bacteroides sp.]